MTGSVLTGTTNVATGTDQIVGINYKKASKQYCIIVGNQKTKEACGLESKATDSTGKSFMVGVDVGTEEDTFASVSPSFKGAIYDWSIRQIDPVIVFTDENTCETDSDCTGTENSKCGRVKTVEIGGVSMGN